MSKVADRGWRIEAQRRRELYLDRIRSQTTVFAARNSERLDLLRQQGLDAFVLADYTRCRESLTRVHRFLARDPEAARDANISLSRMLQGLAGRARENRRAAQAAERDAREAAVQAERDAARARLAAERDAHDARLAQAQAARDELLAMVRDARLSLTGAEARDLCQQELGALRREMESVALDLAELGRLRARLQDRLDAITTAARDKAEALLQAERLHEERREIAALLEDALRSYADLQDDVARAAVQALGSSYERAPTGRDQVEESLATILEAAQERAVQEAARRHVVGGLVREMQQAGFVVADPRLDSGEGGAVVIRAKRPSGPQAAFRVRLDVLTYKFDHYEGDACLTDADQVLPRLQEIYGIELEEERVTWRNPDIIGGASRQVLDAAGERKK
ncbi:hypothetical protein MASR1M32_32140 [Rhodobacter sp.]